MNKQKFITFAFVIVLLLASMPIPVFAPWEERECVLSMDMEQFVYLEYQSGTQDSWLMDSSPYRNHGEPLPYTTTYTGATKVRGIMGYALSFDGSDDYINVPDDDSLDCIGGLTVEFWVRGDDVGGSIEGHPLEHVKANEGGYFVRTDSGSRVTWEVWNTTTSSSLSSDLPDGESFYGNWHHLAFTYSDSDDMMFIYFDGVQLSNQTTTLSMTSTTYSLRLGYHDWAEPANWFRGYLDEVRVYPFALTVSEIEQDATTQIWSHDHQKWTYYYDNINSWSSSPVGGIQGHANNDPTLPWVKRGDVVLKDNYNSGDDGWSSGSQSYYYYAQTFTTSSAYTIIKLKGKWFRVDLPGTLTVAIKATNATGFPTGADLTSGTIDADTFTIATAGAWYEIDVTDYALSASTIYAICIKVSGGGAVDWRKDTSSGYSGGQAFENITSTDWKYEGTEGQVDFMFEVYSSYTTVQIYRYDFVPCLQSLEMSAVFKDNSSNLEYSSTQGFQWWIWFFKDGEWQVRYVLRLYQWDRNGKTEWRAGFYYKRNGGATTEAHTKTFACSTDTEYTDWKFYVQAWTTEDSKQLALRIATLWNTSDGVGNYIHSWYYDLVDKNGNNRHLNWFDPWMVRMFYVGADTADGHVLVSAHDFDVFGTGGDTLNWITKVSWIGESLVSGVEGAYQWLTSSTPTNLPGTEPSKGIDPNADEAEQAREEPDWIMNVFGMQLNLNWLRDIVNTITAPFKGIAQGIYNLLAPAINVIGDLVGAVVNPVINTIGTLVVNALGGTWSVIWTALVSGISTIWQGVLNALDAIIFWVLGSPEGSETLFSDAIDGIVNFLTSIPTYVTWMTSQISNGIDMITQVVLFLSELINNAVEFITNLVTGILTPIVDTMSLMYEFFTGTGRFASIAGLPWAVAIIAFALFPIMYIGHLVKGKSGIGDIAEQFMNDLMLIKTMFEGLTWVFELSWQKFREIYGFIKSHIPTLGSA